MREYRINPDWVKKQKRRILWANIFLAGAVLFFIGMGGGFYYLVRKVLSISPGYDFTQLSLTSRLLFLGSCVIFPIAMVITAYYYHRKQKRILQLVPEHGGRVCPKCTLVMKDNNTDGLLRCPKCKAEWPDEELVKYWEQFVLPMRESAMWLAEKQQEYSANKSKRWFIRLSEIQSFARRRPVAWMGIFASIMIPAYIAFIYYLERNWYSTITKSIQFVPIMFAGTLIGLGFKQRRGKEAHCSSCNYLKPPNGSDDIPNCPECGHAWNEFGGTVYGTVSSKPKLLVIGFLVMFLPMLIPMMRFSSTFSGVYSKAMPTSLLILYAGGRNYADITTWNELNKRNLNQGKRDHLAGLLLDTRDEDNNLDVNQSAWLGVQIKNITIDKEIISRYFESKTTLHITAPDHAITGQSIHFQIDGIYSRDICGYETMVVINSLRQDDYPIQADDLMSTTWESGREFDTDTRNGLITPFNQPRPFTLSFNTPGKHVVHVIVWIAGVPATGYLAPIAVALKADGSPVLPPRAVWSKKIELTRTILVREH